MDFKRETFRVKGDTLEFIPAYSKNEAFRIEIFGDEVDRLTEFDALTGEIEAQLGHVAISPLPASSHQDQNASCHRKHCSGNHKMKVTFLQE